MTRSLAALAAILIATSPAFAIGQSMRTAAGPAYVDGRGMTLYMLSHDPLLASTCYRKCAQVWPPYLVRGYAMPRGPWSIVQRSDGTRMWAYRGHPLYSFFKDRKPGDAYGDGVKDRWGHWRAALVGGGRYVSKKPPQYQPTKKKLDYGPATSGGGGASGGGGY